MLTDVDPRTDLQVRALVRARDNFEAYFRLFPPGAEYKYGRHTEAIIRRMDRATKDLEAGRSTYLVICVPPQHGKSDIVERRWPVWHLCRNPGQAGMIIGYNHEIATDMNYDARKAFETVSPLFGLAVADDRSAVSRWRIKEAEGETLKGILFAAGLGGTITGRGASIIVIGDYCKGRDDAESRRMRERRYHSFMTDIWTRKAPVHVVLICATRWHVDDLAGRIIKRHKDDPDFPEFEVMKFPAQADGGGWLFPERYSDEFYRGLKAMGPYAWAALAQQDPRLREGKLLKTDKVQFVDPAEFDRVTKDVRFARGWDLASTRAETTSDDPDYTVGTRAGYKDGKAYIDGEIRGRWEAVERDGIIASAARADLGEGDSMVYMETVGAYKDSFKYVTKILNGIISVTPCYPSKSKYARNSIMAGTFESGNVVARRGEWNGPWAEEVGGFPDGDHDDRADSLSLVLTTLIMNGDGGGFQFE
ncbi:hypothetical protein LCGC14_1036280 [marine sediment metagenome]|uniref:Terminase large subunit gp17-like C-terminal domain-containing protein n=1 Tax=marine sediment metagenome TaxID=412755 RepID=A0A0F9MXT5_9ZZZZ